MLRSHGDITTREANVVSIPAKNQNNGIKSPKNALTPKTVVSLHSALIASGARL
jgi:hypothetical protein